MKNYCIDEKENCLNCAFADIDEDCRGYPILYSSSDEDEEKKLILNIDEKEVVK